jgi:hypothetical protein
MFTWFSLSAKITQRVSLWRNDAFFALGWRQMRSVLAAPGQRILGYHGLDQRGETTLNGRFLSAARFEEQVRFLSENAHIVALSITQIPVSHQIKITIATNILGYTSSRTFCLLS